MPYGKRYYRKQLVDSSCNSCRIGGKCSHDFSFGFTFIELVGNGVQRETFQWFYALRWESILYYPYSLGFVGDRAIQGAFEPRTNVDQRLHLYLLWSGKVSKVVVKIVDPLCDPHG